MEILVDEAVGAVPDIDFIGVGLRVGIVDANRVVELYALIEVDAGHHELTGEGHGLVVTDIPEVHALTIGTSGGPVTEVGTEDVGIVVALPVTEPGDVAVEGTQLESFVGIGLNEDLPFLLSYIALGHLTAGSIALGIVTGEVSDIVFDGALMTLWSEGELLIVGSLALILFPLSIAFVEGFSVTLLLQCHLALVRSIGSRLFIIFRCIAPTGKQCEQQCCKDPVFHIADNFDECHG